jgi:hypothetical protein
MEGFVDIDSDVRHDSPLGVQPATFASEGDFGTGRQGRVMG